MDRFPGLSVKGEVKTDRLHRIIYSTDASAYREMPLGVVYPEDSDDIRQLVEYAGKHGLTLIPRAGGTSLAGQVVGSGLVVDISRHMNNILEINPEERWVRVQPGVILDDLNRACRKYGLFFGPEASTGNRCCLGGMVGNNACGSHSLIYGSTRDHTLEAGVILGDGSEALLKGFSGEELQDKLRQDDLEGNIYRKLISILSDPDNRDEIIKNYPDPELRRRNTGYALDELLNSDYFSGNGNTGAPLLNLCSLLAGSEGTLAFITELKLNLVPVPPKESALLCVHCNSVAEALQANIVALRHGPSAVELMDSVILELSKHNISQNRNRFFIEGDPAAILIIELAEKLKEGMADKIDLIEADLRKNGYGYHYAKVAGDDIGRVWELRKAGLGLLSGMSGDAKPVSVIEDTAVSPSKLPDYISDFSRMLKKYGLSCVYHAHVGTGELHLRPVLNLKKETDKQLFRTVAEETAALVKRYGGSLSGEHGDGRLRGEFIPKMLGEKVYGLLKEVKKIWDPYGVFNTGKIVDTLPMDQFLRYDTRIPRVDTFFDYSPQSGWICAIEQCNGAGDCRKSLSAPGFMCPSYRATGEEKDTTRARSNILRELLIDPAGKDAFDQEEILEVLDTCISCKACRSECPSNIDMARFKAEYLQHHYMSKGMPLRVRLIGNLSKIHKLSMAAPRLYNFAVRNAATSSLIKKALRFAPQRNLPSLGKITLRAWAKSYCGTAGPFNDGRKKVYLFADEFSNYLDVGVGIQFIKLLDRLGYRVVIPRHKTSGRTEISKGLIRKAKKTAVRNIELLKDIVSGESPLIGIEPSCILTFRDEYLSLVGDDMREAAQKVAENTFLYDEFIVREIERGNIVPSQFTDKELQIVLHGHCHQKSLASVAASKQMLSLPANYSVEIINSGCCGMAGAFGYEKEHFEMSMKIGAQTLFPKINGCGDEVCISAPGTSCRQQIKDGTGKTAYHPIEILYQALK